MELINTIKQARMSGLPAYWAQDPYAYMSYRRYFS